MKNQEDLQPHLRQRANLILDRLSSSEQKELLVNCWMSHDARWFMAVAAEFGMPVVNRLNQIAAHEIGKVEARRIIRALKLTAVKTTDDFLLLQEIFIALLGPDLMDYHVVKTGPNSYQVQVQRCFASQNALRAGIADDYECGIFARITGWLDALGLAYEMTPSLGKCLKLQQQECIYTFTFSDILSP